MRSLFLVGAKLLGIYLILDGLIEGMLLMSGNVAMAPFATQIAVSCAVRLMAGTAACLFHGDRGDGAADSRIDCGAGADV